MKIGISGKTASILKKRNGKEYDMIVELDDVLVAHYLAAKGGRKSKRKLTSDQAKAMAAKSAIARKKKNQSF